MPLKPYPGIRTPGLGRRRNRGERQKTQNEEQSDHQLRRYQKITSKNMAHVPSPCTQIRAPSCHWRATESLLLIHRVRSRSSWLFRRYGTDHHGRNNANPRCQGRVCNESACCPDTCWRQPSLHVTPPGSLARPAQHLLGRGLGRGEVRFRRSENALRCKPAPLSPHSARKPAVKL